MLLKCTHERHQNVRDAKNHSRETVCVCALQKLAKSNDCQESQEQLSEQNTADPYHRQVALRSQ